jgi:hypothetical protein
MLNLKTPDTVAVATFIPVYEKATVVSQDDDAQLIVAVVKVVLGIA